jgi:ubiquinone/menaquinone biosynthesis C-methylase UbiE
LDVLEEKIRKDGLSERVKVKNGSMFSMDFPEESFDIIWAEGSIYIIGFERGLKEWRKFIKAEGFLVVHEMTWLKPDPPSEIAEYWRRMYQGITAIPENLEIISRCGYKVLGHFALPEEAWWEEYYDPLEERLSQLRTKYKDDQEALKILDNEQEEIDLYRKYSEWYGSVFFALKKL